MSVIILGAGEIGYHLARQLCSENRDVVVVEISADKIAQLEESGEDLSIIHGNGSNPDILKKAGVEKASMLIAVTNRDETNITACYVAAQLSKKIKKLARVRDIDTHIYGHLFNQNHAIIDSIINPEELCAIKISHLLQFPGVMDLNRFFDGRAILAGMKLHSHSTAKGKSLIEIGKDRSKYGFNFLIASIIRGNEGIVPSGPSVVEENDLIYIMTLEKELQKVVAYICGPQPDIKEVAILGGTNTGYYLGRLLEQSNKFNTKLLENDTQRVQFLSENLPKTLVLKGELLERDIYQNEGIYRADVFVAVTADQEDNIIAALDAKSQGVKMGICILSKPHIEPLAKNLGIDVCLHPQQLAIGKMLEYIRKGNIASVVLLHRNDIEVIELTAIANSPLVHKPLKDIKLPKSSLMLAIARKDATIEIPTGNSVVSPDERVIFIAKKESVPMLERLINA